MKCWNCAENLEDPKWGKISFRALCEKCGAALHCCHNCKYYEPGRPNDCMIPETDFISDRTANNFCEEFHLTDKTPSPQKKNTKQRFDDLFKE